MAETYGDYFRGLGMSIGQGVTFGFGDEIEAGASVPSVHWNLRRRSREDPRRP